MQSILEKQIAKVCDGEESAERVAGVVLYHGPSLYDGNPIVAIATGLDGKSTNRKTGPMVQVWIFRADRLPTLAWKDNTHQAVCGDCKHGHANANSCYVNLGLGPNGIFRAWQRGVYRDVPVDGHPVEDIRRWFAGRKVRFGAFGDPAAVPFEVWQPIVETVRSTSGGYTGYTHGWRRCDPRLKDIAVASVDTPEELVEARAAGWRTFRTLLAEEQPSAGEFMCPATDEARTAVGKEITCADCLACNGLNGRGSNRRGSAAIRVHGIDHKIHSYTALRVSAARSVT